MQFPVIIFDTETTGLPQPSSADLSAQPYIIEFAGLKVNEDLEVVGSIEFMCKPPIPLPPEITKITGIKPVDLEDKHPFGDWYWSLAEFYWGTPTMLAHNLPFDRSLLSFDLTRIGKQFNFPWPIEHTCTVEATYHLKNRRLKMLELYEMATGSPLAQTHRAMDDVEALLTCVRWCVEEGIPL